MTDREPVDTFDLPDDCQHDHVLIYESDAVYEPPFRAVPFEYVGDDDLHNGYYQEPEEYAVTEQYREAVAERATVDIEDVKLPQPPTVDPEETDPV
jgi:hypothetical protein